MISYNYYCYLTKSINPSSKSVESITQISLRKLNAFVLISNQYKVYTRLYILVAMMCAKKFRIYM